MKNIKVIMSCDNNPFYYEFWNDVSKIWNITFGFDPVLIFISNEKNKYLSEEYGQIIQVPEVKDIPIYLQAQTARIYHAKLFPNDVCMMSDIDIIPVDKKFFDLATIISRTNENEFFHLNPVSREFGQFPMCYYSAYGKTFNKLFDNKTWQQFLKTIVDYNFDASKLGYMLPPHLKDKNLWFSDELFLYSEINKSKININLNDLVIHPHQRLDREQLLSDYKSLNNFIDCHMPRPFSLYERQINYLIYQLENA